MPKVSKSPRPLRSYLFHGLDLEWNDGNKEATCDCPACGSDDGKASVNLETGVCGCWHSSCDQFGSNPTTFVRWLWEESHARTTDYDAMARDMELGGDVFTIELGFEQVHVFWSR